MTHLLLYLFVPEKISMDTVQIFQINSEEAQKSYSRLKGRKEATHLLTYLLYCYNCCNTVTV